MAQNSAGVIDAYLIQIFQIGCLGVPSEPGAEIIAAETHNGCCLPQRDFLRKVCLRPVEDLTQLRILGRERFGFETLFRRGLAFELAENLQKHPDSSKRVAVQADHFLYQRIDRVKALANMWNCVD